MFLDAQNLSYAYQDIPLFESLTLQIQSPGLYLIKGPNGSGKTTFLKMLSGILKPLTGTVQLTSQPLYIGHLNALHDELTLSAMIDSYRHFLDGSFSDKSHKALVSMGLIDYMDVKIAELSYGQKRKAALMRLFLVTSSCWILDEPFQGLDQAAQSFLWREIEAFVHNGGACLMTTHDHDSEIRLLYQTFEITKSSSLVMPAEAGIQRILQHDQDSLMQMDSCFCRNDKEKNQLVGQQ